MESKQCLLSRNLNIFNENTGIVLDHLITDFTVFCLFDSLKLVFPQK